MRANIVIRFRNAIRLVCTDFDNIFSAITNINFSIDF